MVSPKISKKALTPEQARLRLEKRKKERDAIRARIRADLFERQLQVFDDGSPQVVIGTGRRSGKTTLEVAKLLDSAVAYPGELNLYLSFSWGDAKETLWDLLLEKAERWGIPVAKELESTATLVLRNRSIIRLGGVSTPKEARKVLGKGAHGYRFVAFDEMQDWADPVIRKTYLKLKPALLDRGGTIWMAGTPGLVRRGFYFDAAEDRTKGWKRFYWTMWENPFMAPQAERFIREDAEEQGIDPEDPAFLREYRGLWVEDKEARAYGFDEPLNVYDPDALNGGLEQHVRDDRGNVFGVRWRHVLGVDFGKVDADALVVLAYSDVSNDVREVYSFKKRDEDITDLAGNIKRVQRMFPGVHIVADHAAKDILELQKRHGINVHNAEKTDKRMGRRWLNSDLRRGVFKVRKGSPLLDEWRALMVDAEKNEVEPAENHLSDACLYAYRAVRHFRPREPRKLPLSPYGVDVLAIDAYYQERADRIGREALAEIERKRQQKRMGVFGVVPRLDLGRLRRNRGRDMPWLPPR